MVVSRFVFVFFFLVGVNLRFFSAIYFAFSSRKLAAVQSIMLIHWFVNDRFKTGSSWNITIISNLDACAFFCIRITYFIYNNYTTNKYVPQEFLGYRITFSSIECFFLTLGQLRNELRIRISFENWFRFQQTPFFVGVLFFIYIKKKKQKRVFILLYRQSRLDFYLLKNLGHLHSILTFINFIYFFLCNLRLDGTSYFVFIS